MGTPFHYLDDFFVLWPPQQAECAEALRVAIDTCLELGVPVAQNKVEGPATVLTFLGIQVDTWAGALSLPPMKLERTRNTITEWLARKAATKRELQSLIRPPQPRSNSSSPTVDLSQVAH